MVPMGVGIMVWVSQDRQMREVFEGSFELDGDHVSLYPTERELSDAEMDIQEGPIPTDAPRGFPLCYHNGVWYSYEWPGKGWYPLDDELERTLLC